MKRTIALFMVLLCFPVFAQGAIPITADTAADVTRLETWGPGRARSAAFSANGKLLAVATTNGIQVYETGAFGDGDLLTTDGDFSAGSVVFLPDNETVFGASTGYNVRAYDTTTGEMTYESYPNIGNALGVVALAPDGQRVAIGAGNTLNIFDVETSELLFQTDGHIQSISSAAYAPDSARIVTGSLDMTLNVWDAATGAHIVTMSGHTDGVTSVAFTPDGAQVVSTSRDGSIRVWDAATGVQVSDMTPTELPITAGALNPDGTVLAMGDESGAVLLIDLASAAVVAGLSDGGQAVNNLTYSRDGLLLAGVRPGRAQVWDVVGLSEIGTAAYEAGLTTLAVSDDGSSIAAGGDSGTTFIFNMDGTVRTTIAAPAPPVTGLAFSHDVTVIHIASEDAGIAGIALETGEAVSYLQSSAATVAMTMHPTQDMINAAAADGALFWWDTTTNAELGSTYTHEAPLSATAFSPDGRWMASADESGVIFLWDVSTGDFIDTLDGADSAVRDLAFSRDGELVAAALERGVVAVWIRTDPEKMAFELTGFYNIVVGVEFSPDNTVIATASYDGTVRLFNTAGEAFGTYYDHNSPVHDVAFSPDGTRLYSVGDDGKVIVWGVFQ